MVNTASTPRPPPIRARLLGEVEIRVGETILTTRDWPRRHARSVLLLLLGTSGHWLPRDAVLDAIWPSADLDASLNAFYKALHTLRRTLEPGLRSGRESSYIDVSGDRVVLRPHEDLWVDVHQFERLLREAETSAEPRPSLRSALDLYRGELVADEPYVEWPVAQREALRSMRERAALRLAGLDREYGDPLASVGYLEAILADDPTFEEAHRAIIRALLESGQRAAALRQVERCRLAVEREFGVGLDPETEALAVAARATPAPALDAVARGARTPFLNLPSLPTSTVGRTEEIAAVRAMLADADTRLVTIVGSGGVGKTRLAIEAARGAGPEFPDGVAFVDLSVIRDPGFLFPSIAAALQLSEAPDRPIAETVQDALIRRERFLLVLDNLEHLSDLAKLVAELLANVPTLRMLATSREPLRIRVERIYLLEPLPLPEQTVDTSPEVLKDAASVALFLQCAQAWGGVRDLGSSSSLPVIADLCRQLEGLPLAIEIAAAHTWDTSPEVILAQLEDRFEALRDGPRDLPKRHQTLNATIMWSYDLLSPLEQEVFRGLSVFSGGVEIDALREVFGADAAIFADALVEKNLLRWEQRHGVRRLTMLESIREFAANLLARFGEGESDALRLRHARCFAGLAGRIVPELRGAGQLAALQHLERDQENLHVAVSTALDMGAAELTMHLTSLLGFFWSNYPSPRQATAWIEQMLKIAPDTPAPLLGWTLLGGAALSWRLADMEATERYERAARTVWESLNLASGVAWAEYFTACRAGRAGRYADVETLHAAGLEVFRSVGDTRGIVLSLAGVSYGRGMQGDQHEAAATLREALAVARKTDDLVLQSYVLARLPTTLLLEGEPGNLAEAERMAAEGERTARLVGDLRALPWATLVRAGLAFDREEYESALEYAQATLAAFRDASDTLNEFLGAHACALTATYAGRLDDARAYALITIQLVQDHGALEDKATVLPELAELVLALGYPDEALVAYSAGISTDERLGVPIPEDNLKRHQRRIAEARSRLEADEADAAWVRGETIDADDALEIVRRVAIIGRAA